jgi:hypothetical protein
MAALLDCLLRRLEEPPGRSPIIVFVVAGLVPKSTCSIASPAKSQPDLAVRVERALHAAGYKSLRAAEVAVCGQIVILKG